MHRKVLRGPSFLTGISGNQETEGLKKLLLVPMAFRRGAAKTVGWYSGIARWTLCRVAYTTHPHTSHGNFQLLTIDSDRAGIFCPAATAASTNSDNGEVCAKVTHQIH